MNELKRWDKIRAGSKITLSKDTYFKGLCKGEKDTLIKKGTYFINGFWANAVGIGLNKQDVYDSNNKYGIYSIQLKKFNEVEE